jgi:hypothetical protein
MRKLTIACCLLLLIPALLVRARAQETAKAPETVNPPEPPAHYYHLEYVIQELGSDGKPTNSRTYSTTVGTDRHQQFSAIRTGSRVPIITGALHSPTNGPNGESKLEFQYQYLDVGVNIDTQNVREVGHQLAIDLKAEVSSLAETGPSTASGLVNDPVIRQNMWQASVLIPVGKPTVVFSSDALDSKGAMHLLVTATPLQ